MDIDKLEPGHALDELIHSKVMGWKLLTLEEMQAEADRVWKEQPTCRAFMMGFEARELPIGSFEFRNCVKSYSTKIAEAWEVAVQIQRILNRLEYTWIRIEPLIEGTAIVTVVRDGEDLPAHVTETIFDSTEGSDGIEIEPVAAPLAICRIALKVVGA